MARVVLVEVNYNIENGRCRVTAWDATGGWWQSVGAPNGDGFRSAINATIDAAITQGQQFIELDVTGWQRFSTGS